MKVLLINGSPKEKGCTYTALKEVEKQLNINNILLSEIEISDVREDLKLYFTIAKNFQEIIIKNLQERNVSTSVVEKAKFGKWITPIKLMLENKEILNVTGVEGVDNFNDETVVLMTTKGRLTIKGENLSISKLNVDEGKLMVKGIINSLVFSEYEGRKEKVSLVKKLFK